MKQKIRVSMMVVLVLIISVVFVACDSAVNQHKTKTKDIVSQKSEFYFERKINTQTVSGVTTKSFDTITNNASMTFSKINYSDGSSRYVFSYTFYKQLHGDGAIKKHILTGTWKQDSRTQRTLTPEKLDWKTFDSTSSGLKKTYTVNLAKVDLSGFTSSWYNGSYWTATIPNNPDSNTGHEYEGTALYLALDNINNMKPGMSFQW